jgi:hypothetical protein
LSRWLSTLSARRRALMVFRASRLGPRRLLTDYATAPPPSPRSRCWEGGGFGPWADDAPARLRSERWREAELSACCAAAALSNAFSCWYTRRSSKVDASEQPRSSMAAASRFCDAHRKSGGASASALASMFAPSLARWLLLRVPRAPVAFVRARAAGRQPDGTRVGRLSPHGAPHAQGCLVQAVCRGARHPCPALGEEGPAPHRAGASPLRAHRGAPAAGRRWCGGAEPAQVRSCSMWRPCRRCIPAWDRAIAWSVPSESSQTQGRHRSCGDR